MAKRTSPPPENCPVCGADVPPRALACPECGADESTGWNTEESGVDGLDLPEEHFDYQEFVKKEFGGEKIPRGISWYWWLAGLAVLAAFLYRLFF